MAALSCGGQCLQVIGSVAKLRQSGRQPKFTHEIRYAFGYGRGDGHPECVGDRNFCVLSRRCWLAACRTCVLGCQVKVDENEGGRPRDLPDILKTASSITRTTE